jgi:hypothetical protein
MWPRREQLRRRESLRFCDTRDATRIGGDFKLSSRAHSICCLGPREPLNFNGENKVRSLQIEIVLSKVYGRRQEATAPSREEKMLSKRPSPSILGDRQPNPREKNVLHAWFFPIYRPSARYSTIRLSLACSYSTALGSSEHRNAGIKNTIFISASPLPNLQVFSAGL